MKKNKLVLIESEMLSPKGHFLDNLIETTKTFENQNKIYWLINKRFYDEGTYIPKNIKIIKTISSNYFKRKKNKLFYILEEIFFFLKNLLEIIYYSLFFLKEKNFLKFFNAFKSNFFILPRYFGSFYKEYKKLKLTENDNVFFQTARRKDMALVNFLIKIDEKHPKFHIRVMLPPKIKFKGFFYYLNQLKSSMENKRVFVYTWSEYNFNYFKKNSISKIGIYKSNIPWSFYKRNNLRKKLVIGFMGDARKARGFQNLPKIINLLKKNNHQFNYIIQYSKISNDLLDVKKELINLSKKDKNIYILEKYCDYKEFRNILKKIDIMPIIHSAEEINKITSGTMYSCISNEIVTVIPKGTNFMNDIMKYKSFEKAANLEDIAKKIIKISKNYKFYLKNVKLNSLLLKKILEKDPLKKYIT